MPIPEEVGDFLSSLVGAPVAASKLAKLDVHDEDDESMWYTAIYLEDDDRVGGACVADLRFAASTGAALAMMPKAVVEDALKAGALIESLHENYYEVANVLTGLLNGPSVPHLRIGELVAGVPETIDELLQVAAGRKNYDVSIVGYTGGRLVLVAAAPADRKVSARSGRTRSPG